MHHVHQIGGCQRNRREGIPTAGFHRNADILTQLIVNRRNLRFTGSDGHSRIGVHLLDLTVDSLHHGLIAAICLFEDLDKLLRADVIGQRPQTFS